MDGRLQCAKDCEVIGEGKFRMAYSVWYLYWWKSQSTSKPGQFAFASRATSVLLKMSDALQAIFFFDKEIQYAGEVGNRICASR